MMVQSDESRRSRESERKGDKLNGQTDLKLAVPSVKYWGLTISPHPMTDGYQYKLNDRLNRLKRPFTIVRLNAYGP